MERTDPHGMRVVSAVPRRRKSDTLKSWLMIAGVITTTGAAAGVLMKVIAWPWEAKGAAAAVVTKLEEKDKAIEARVTAVEMSIQRIETKLEAMPAKTATEVVGELVKQGAFRKR